MKQRPSNLSVYVKTKLLQQGNSMKDLSEYLGIDPSTLHRWLKRKTISDYDKLIGTSLFLNVRIDNLLDYYRENKDNGK